MKNVATSILGALAAVVLLAPGGFADSPVAPDQEAIKARYFEFQKAMSTATSFDQVRSYHTAETAAAVDKTLQSARLGAQPDAAARDSAFGALKRLMPPEVKVVGIDVKGDNATLLIEPGKSTALYKVGQNEGTVSMHFENGLWQVGETAWKNKVSPVQKAVAANATSWCAEAVNLPFVQKPAEGMISGKKFVVQEATFNRGTLNLVESANGPTRSIGIALEDFAIRPDGKIFYMRDGRDMGQKIVVMTSWPTASGQFGQHNYTWKDPVGLKLQFGKRSKGLLPVFLVLRLPDVQKSYLQGYVYATVYEP